MEIFNHTFVNAHIIGCSPVTIKYVTGEAERFYQLELYTTGGLHVFKSEPFQNSPINDDEQQVKIKSDIWKENADRYINFIESLNPSNYDQV